MESIDLYYDHYKDTFEHLKGCLKKRDNYTIMLFVMVIVLSFQLNEPQESVKLADLLIKNKLNNITINFKYVNTVLVYAFLWLTILYYQINLLIEKTYKYIHEIEDKLSETGNYPINREGKNYLNYYPWLSFIVHRIYTILFPILIIVIASFKAYHEYNTHQYDLSCVDILGISITILSSALYLSNRYLKEEYFSKKIYAGLHLGQRILGYLKLKKYS
jgi:hypothetical protein